MFNVAFSHSLGCLRATEVAHPDKRGFESGLNLSDSRVLHGAAAVHDLPAAFIAGSLRDPSLIHHL